MTELSALWLPVVVSALLVFILSSIIHMAPLWHRTDYPPLANQDRVLDALRPFDLPRGDYMLPRSTSMAEMRSPEFMEKMSRGPVLIMTVLPKGPWTMGKQLAQWFVYVLVVSLFSAYVAGRALPPGAGYLDVFRFSGTAAFLSYSVALWQMSIWYQRSWGMSIKGTVDGLIYAVAIAGVFGALWP